MKKINKQPTIVDTNVGWLLSFGLVNPIINNLPIIIDFLITS